MNPLRTPDVLVVGGGVIGCAVAHRLAGAGRRVLVVDRGAIGGEASSAAAGVLAAASGDDDGDRLALRRASLAAFPDLVALLRDETGIDVGFAACGVVRTAPSEAALETLRALAAARRTQGYRADILDRAALRAAEPATAPGAFGGVSFPDDATVVAGRLVAALAEAARRRGAVLVPGAPALAVERAARRILRVRVGSDWIAPGLVVVAAGAWGGAIPGLDVGVSVEPVRGQMLSLRPDVPPRRVLACGDAFVVPRPDGEVWVGATFERAGFAKAVTPEGLRTLVEHLRAVTPGLVGAPMVRAWAGLRPCCPDGGPVLGPVPSLTGVLVALGHHRNGILLAPITAETIHACADGVDAPRAAVPFVRTP